MVGTASYRGHSYRRERTCHFVPLSIFLPILVGGGLIAYLRKRINGYTGDTCGALCLLSELATLTGFAILYRLGLGV